MGVASVQFHSPALGKSVTYRVILPEVGTGPFPVLMQLHGLSDDDSAWIQRSNLVRHVADFPLIVVLPDGGTSGYLNWRSHDRLGKQNYEDLLIDDLPAHLTRHFQVRPGSWAIGGLSMGGYGAMRLGLKYPDRFASIWAHSSAFHIGQLVEPSFVADTEDADVYVHADRVARMPTRPAIAFDCGADDELIGHNRAFHAHLEALGLAHHYAEHPGGHTWDYWDTHVQEALRQHAQILGLA
ncbi:MAG: putative tributyrin esterase [Thermomicrobiales bacterium]|nr:putative tributyrin esterase [Thermomicrobiales bacterium]